MKCQASLQKQISSSCMKYLPITSFFVIIGLEPYTYYTIAVAATSDFGVGIYSEDISIQTMEDGK